MNSYLTSILIFIFTLATSLFAQTAEKTLTEQLREKVAASKAKAPAEKQLIMNGAIEKLRNSHITEHAVQKGGQLPAFTLPDVSGKSIASKELLKKGPLIVVFYRGGWCPYCNLQLHDLQKHLETIKSLGAQLVAISPQTPDDSLSTAEKGALKFYVLSDANNNVARQFGLVYKLPKELVKLYKEFGIDLEKSNGNKSDELPVSATYIADSSGKIIYSFLDVDYKKRAETLDLIKELKALKQH